MGEFSGIEWTHHTFNPWIGCTKVSPACDNCYAEAYNKRYDGGKNWGPKAPRRKTRPANWNLPRRWDKKAAEAGVRQRVFCASLADVFDNQVPEEWRAELWELIKATPNLDWLLLTKRPQNIAKMLPADWGQGYPNVWLGTTVENQKSAAQRVPHLLDVPAALHFLSCEPLLGALEIPNYLDPRTCSHGRAVAWVIAGGESGPNWRPSEVEWFQSLRDQCAAFGVPFLFKQWSGPSTAAIKALGRKLDGVVHNGYPPVGSGVNLAVGT